jgi:hypothetical protein
MELHWHRPSEIIQQVLYPILIWQELNGLQIAILHHFLWLQLDIWPSNSPLQFS